MSNALLRRNSSKQGLQNLMRLTAQRSIEDAKEVERECRRKARESLRRRNSGSKPEDSSPETDAPEERNVYDHELKPGNSPSLEEDEGFGDWSQGREKQRHQHLQKLNHDGEEEEKEESVFVKSNLAKRATHVVCMPFRPVQSQDEVDTNDIRMESERMEEAGTAKKREDMKNDKEVYGKKQAIQRPNREEERKNMREDMEQRRMEVAKRMKNLSTSSTDGEEVFSPSTTKVSTHKITERNHSLNRSLKKSNSFKKTQPVFLLTRMDDRLEQYTHAVEKISQEPRAVKVTLTDLSNSPEVVATKKNLFEAGESWSPIKGATCKDTGSLKVGVADLITHWVKGPSETISKQSSCRPSDLKSGVLQKKNLWENLGDSSVKNEPKTKLTTHGKMHKFVFTGHGKYEKI